MVVDVLKFERYHSLIFIQSVDTKCLCNIYCYFFRDCPEHVAKENQVWADFIMRVLSAVLSDNVLRNRKHIS